MIYRREIDGLRAVAVISVVAYHGGVPWFSGGYIGVDVFFVISGFLITSILLIELEAERMSIGRFYERRARRILPALFLVLFATLVMGWLWMIPAQFSDLSATTIAVILFASNIFFWRSTDYFSPVAEENPLLHTWSLAVEEQFYLFFPLLLLAAWRLGRRHAFWLVMVGSLISLVLCEWASRTMPVANFYLLPFRAWELGSGAVCAFLLHRRSMHPNGALSLFGLLLVLVPTVLYDESTRFPSLYSLAPVAGTALMIMFASETTAIGRLLSMRPFVGIGLVSYSAYLWHQPLFAFARIRNLVGHPPPVVAAGLIMLTFALAAISWRYVEQPFRSRGPLGEVTRSRVFAASLAASVAFGLVGALGLLTAGFHDAWISRHPDARETLNVIERAFDNRRTQLKDGHCGFNVEGFGANTMQRVLDCSRKIGPAVLVFGDSHSIDIYNGMLINQVYDDKKIVGIRCRIHTDLRCADALRKFIVANPSVFERIVYTQAGFHLLRTSDEKSGRAYISGIPLNGTIEQHAFQVADDSVAKVSSYLDRLSDIANVTWIGPRLEPHISQAAILRRSCAGQFQLRKGQRELYQRLDSFIARMATGGNYRYISQQGADFFDETKDFINCETWFWRDGDHWSLDGSRRFVARLVKMGAFQ